jgi:MinD superfamily P-loop ATPase
MYKLELLTGEKIICTSCKKVCEAETVYLIPDKDGEELLEEILCGNCYAAD